MIVSTLLSVRSAGDRVAVSSAVHADIDGLNARVSRVKLGE